MGIGEAAAEEVRRSRARHAHGFLCLGDGVRSKQAGDDTVRTLRSYPGLLVLRKWKNS